MLQQLPNRVSVHRIFVQTSPHEILASLRNINLFRKIYFLLNLYNHISYDLHQVADLTNLKRSSAIQQLISKNTNTPNINLAIIRLFLNNLGRSIDGCATLSLPQKRRMNSPTEITYFYGVLNNNKLTSCKRMF